jgi:TolB-like protein
VTQDYFADGMTEALTRIWRAWRLCRCSRYSTMQYKPAKKPLRRSPELHADVVVEGSVQRSGDRVRITAQLIRAATDKHLWAGKPTSATSMTFWLCRMTSPRDCQTDSV